MDFKIIFLPVIEIFKRQEFPDGLFSLSEGTPLTILT